ncbi:MAG: Fic family protein [Candidatus Pacebacteria bacterium]|nr:Fic family protein [Candidatus Paceibacterota bacterium]
MNILEKEYYKQYEKEINIDLAVCFNDLKKDSSKINFKYLTEASAVYSSNIEGNSMDLNSFMNAKTMKQKAKPKEYSEITELVDAYDFAQSNKLTEENLLKAHQILSKSFLIKSQRGKYRDDKVGVFDQNGLVYLAIEPEKVAEEMKIFFVTINKLLKQDLDINEVFYFASMLHLRFAHIHPFQDGNGRAARILEKWFLASKLGNKAWLIQSEKYYKENIKEYYQNINLGVNFYELDYERCLPFLLMLPLTFR